VHLEHPADPLAVAEAVRRSPQFIGGTCSSALAMHRALVD
jgi:hypothetical protein